MSAPVPGPDTAALPLPGRRQFVWATGIEDTFVGASDPRTGRTLDEYEMTGHYRCWDDDLRLAADLGVSAIRYGLPWYRANPAPGKYDWSWTDQVLERLVNTYRLEPILDLVHYGTPLWLDRAALNPDYPARVADWAAAVAERYRRLCSWYTPLNEPRVNAWYAGQIGWWPPYAHGWRGFVGVLRQLCRGICLTQRAIAHAQPDARFVHVDATDLYVARDPGDGALAAEAERRQALVFLALDLVMGRVGTDHPLAAWLAALGLKDDDLGWFREHSVQPDVVGYNMYPMYSRKEVRRVGAHIRVGIRPCWTETLASLTRMYSERYAPLPLMVTETASRGSHRRRIQWIDESVAAIGEAREAGVPVVGYCFWPLFSLVGWAYQRSSRPAERYLIDMGLYDLVPRDGRLSRQHTPVVDAYRRVVAAGAPVRRP